MEKKIKTKIPNSTELTFRAPKNDKEKLELLKFGDAIFSTMGWPKTEEFDEKYFDDSQYIFVGCYNQDGEILGHIKVKKFLKTQQAWKFWATGLQVFRSTKTPSGFMKSYLN